MEALPQLPMLSFDFRTYYPKNATFGLELPQLINQVYDEDPNNFMNEIEQLDTLRQQAMSVNKNIEGCNILKRYFCQLCLLGKRFPTLKNAPESNEISWKDVWPMSGNKKIGFTFEYVTTLYNIGAMHTQLGAAIDRTNPEGLKLACTHFQCAAWAFQSLQDSIISYNQPDFNFGLLQFLIPICLAQAQECIAEKSITGSRKLSTSATVVAQICDYYETALTSLNLMKQDDSVMIDGMKATQVWPSYVKFKKVYYESITNLLMGLVVESEEKWGERVAFFETALEKLDISIQYFKNVDIPSYNKGLYEALSLTHDIVEGKRSNAVKENDFIYHEPVPAKDTLRKTGGSSLVKGIGFDYHDPKIAGPDIFNKLISMKVHELSSQYSEEKAQLLRRITSSIEAKDTELDLTMNSYKLDFLNPHDNCNSLPEELIDKCAVFQSLNDPINELEHVMDELQEAHSKINDTLNKIFHLIEDEEKADEEFQTVMRTTNRSRSIISTDLHCQANIYKEQLQRAAESNEKLCETLKVNKNNFKLLSLAPSELVNQLPRISYDYSTEEAETVQALQKLVDKVEEMRRQRSVLILQLRDDIQNDDITHKLAIDYDDKSSFSSFIANEISKHDDTVGLIEQNLKAQVNILSAFKNTYARYAPIRRIISQTWEKRVEQLESLSESIHIYEQLQQKTMEGQTYYSKLHESVNKLLSRVSSACDVQGEERLQIYENAGKSRPSLPPKSEYSQSYANNDNTAPSSAPKLKDYLKPKMNASISTNSTAIPSNTSITTNYQHYPINGNALYSNTMPSYNEYSYKIPPNVSYAGDTTRFHGHVSNSNTTTTTFPHSYTSYTPNMYTNVAPNANTVISSSHNLPAGTATNTLSNNHQPQIPINNQQQYPYNYAIYPYSQVSNSTTASVPVSVVKSNIPTTTSYSGNYYSNTSVANYTAGTNNTGNSSAFNLTPHSKDNHYTLPNNNNSKERPSYGLTNTNAAVGIEYGAQNAYTTNIGYPLYNQTQYPPTTSVYSPQSTPNYSAAYMKSNVNTPGNVVQPSSSAMNQSQMLPPSSATSISNYVCAGAMMHNNSNYTNAGLNATENIESFAKSLDGRSYAIQYASSSSSMTNQTMTTTGNTTLPPNSYTYNGNNTDSRYYALQYGNEHKLHQFNGTEITQGPANQKPRLTHDNSMTYMQSGTGVSVKCNVATSQSSSITSSGNCMPQKKVESNVDLLAELDFTLTDTPLIPVVASTSSSVKTEDITDKIVKLNIDASNNDSNAATETINPETSINTINTTSITDRCNKNSNTVKSNKMVIKKDVLESDEYKERLVHEAQKFDHLLEKLNVKTLNGSTTLDIFWNDYVVQQERFSRTRSTSEGEKNSCKNKSTTDLPYNHSRVFLSTTDCDYINASILRMTNSPAPDVIVTQSPMTSTMKDFWTMIWEQEIELVVCLANDEEIDPYWPKDKKDRLVVGDFVITLLSTKSQSHHVERILSVTRSDTTKVVTQIQLLANWNSPHHTKIIAQIVDECIVFYQDQCSLEHSIVVHGDVVKGIAGVLASLLIFYCDILYGKGIPELMAVLMLFSDIRKDIINSKQLLELCFNVAQQCINNIFYKYNIVKKTPDLIKPIDVNQKNVNALCESECAVDANVTDKKTIIQDPFSSIDPLWSMRKDSK